MGKENADKMNKNIITTNYFPLLMTVGIATITIRVICTLLLYMEILSSSTL